MVADVLDVLLALSIGFAIGGLLSSGYQLLTARPLGFRLILQGVNPQSLVAVPLLVFAAPFLILRNALRRTPLDVRPLTVAFAILLACLWSVMSGTVVAAGWVELVRVLA